MSSARVVVVTDENFEAEVLRSPVPVLVDFWASWCPPCRALLPVIDEIAEEKGDDAKVVKIDVEANPELRRRFKVQSIPLLLFIKDGEVRDQQLGAVSKAVLSGKLDALGK